MLSIDVLTPRQMEAIDQRQAKLQSEWKSIPPEGKIVPFLGMELMVLPGVFPPNESTVLLAEHSHISAGVTVLDVGTGTGALALWAAQHGAASVVAVDIAEAAVRNAKRNVERLGLGNRVDVRAGHVFSSITQSEIFDIILANLPCRNKAAVDDTSQLSGTRNSERIERYSEKQGLTFDRAASSIWCKPTIQTFLR
ncbi:MAG TPA: class I SAM-dependent methyltransferase [Candidatus Binatia bacterium]|jgi:release factor glutamine methyltransferase